MRPRPPSSAASACTSATAAATSPTTSTSPAVSRRARRTTRTWWSPRPRCSRAADGTQHDMIDDIQGKNLDGLVVASCSPKLHQVTFRGVSKRADLNPYAYTQVNIREQDSWAHTDDRDGRHREGDRAGPGRGGQDPAVDPARAAASSRPTRRPWSSAGESPACARRSGSPTSASTSSLVERDAHGRRLGRPFGPCSRTTGAAATRSTSWSPRSTQRPTITVLTERRAGRQVGELRQLHGRGPLRPRHGTEELRQLAGRHDHHRDRLRRLRPEAGEFGYGIDGVVTLPEFKAMVDQAKGGR